MSDIPGDHNLPESVPTLTLVWPSVNFEILSRLCNCLALSDSDCDLLLRECAKLQIGLSSPRNTKELRDAEAAAFSAASFDVLRVPVPGPRTRRGHLMVEDEGLCMVQKNLLTAIQELVNTPEHAKWMIWSAAPVLNDIGDRLYSELHTADWWERQQNMLPGSDPHILACIISSDETPTTMTGRKVCPVYATCGNLPLWHRQKPGGLILIGFIPIIRPLKAFSNSQAVRSYRRNVKRWCMGMLLKPLMDHANGVMLEFMKPDKSIGWRWVYPRFPFLIGDEPEVMHAAVGGYGSTMSRMPCSHCDVVPRLQGMRTLGRPRDISIVKNHMCIDTQTSTMTMELSKRISMHREFSFMPFVPGFNPHMNPSDRMHQFDHGVFMQVKELVVEYIKTNYSAGSLQIFDMRWSRLARFTGMKIFARGVSSLAFVPCFENRMMAMGLPFVLRGMGGRRIPTADARMPLRGLEDLCITYLATRWLVARPALSTTHIQTLGALCDDLQQKIDAMHLILYGSPVTTGIKFHKLLHWVHYVREFGCSGNWNTEVFESAHKEVKRWKRCLSYRRGESAAIKIMRQMAVRDGHTDSMPTRTNSRPKGKGPGGFRGKISLARARGLSVDELHALQTLESHPDFLHLAVEELHEEYMTILPPSCEDIAMLSTLLNTTTTCLDMCTSQTTTQDSQGYFHMCFFRPESHNVLQCWQKTYCQEASAYVSINHDVRYVMMDRHDGTYTRHIGRVRWILSLPNEKQFLVMQRFEEVTAHDSDNITARLHACVRPGYNRDPIKRHCSHLRLRPMHLVESYHILVMSGEEEGDEIEEMVVLHPDFGETRTTDSVMTREDHSNFFLMEYLIL
jgi:Plavaka transposase